MSLFEAVPSQLVYRPAVVMLTALVILTLLSQFGQYLFLELTTHFRLQYVLTAVACALVFTIYQSWKFVPIAVLCAILNGVYLAPYWRAPEAQNGTGQPFRVLHANVLKDNQNYEGALRLIQQSNADLLVLQEVTDDWVQQLKVLEKEYPYFKSVPGLAGSGMALFSRFAFADLEVLTLDESTHIAIKAKIKVGENKEVTVLSLHPTTPITASKFANRNRQFKAASTIMRSTSGPKFIIGDLNTTMWSPYFTDLVRTSGLRDARKGFGLVNSWPMPLPSFLRLPIDHCLVSDDVKVSSIKLGPGIRSDHRPLVIDLLL